ncbi:MAG: hypothetical protein ACYS1C_12090, partial [Planctomycetota bacterium]
MAKAPPGEIEEQNLAQIEMLNQRGGRTLSIIDLIDDGTITAQMAALCWLLVERGAGLLTGAVPGGAGKTTLMGGILAFLPPGERIVTVAEDDALRRAREMARSGPVTLLAHEIGAGHWYAYIWGRRAVEFFALGRLGVRCVSCLHADTPEETSAMLRS